MSKPLAAVRRGWTADNGHKNIIREIIGRVVYGMIWKKPTRKTIDQTVVNYQFWDDLRRGRARGYEVSGTFCWPLAQIVTSHVVGEGTSAELVAIEEDTPDIPSDENIDYTNSLLARLMARFGGQLTGMVDDLYGLGDQYLIINPDGTFSLPSPDTVAPVYSKLDYRTLEAVTVTTQLDDYEITDTYRADGRTVTIKYLTRQNNHPAGYTETVEYQNLIGRLSVVHFPNDRSGNETNGRPIYEGMLTLLSRYDDLIQKALDGAELEGIPVPVIENIENVNEVFSANDPETDETYFDLDGNEITRPILNFDTRAGLILGKGAHFQFAHPAVGFTEDIKNMLKLLFLLMCDYTRVPEPLWGGAVEYKSGVGEQMKPFYQYIMGRRQALEGEGSDTLLGMEAQGGLLEVLEIWLAWRRITDPRVVVAPVRIRWPRLGDVDAEIRLKWVTFLRNMGLMDKVETVMQSGLVDDAQAVVEAADEEGKKDNPADQAQQELLNAIDTLRQPPSGDETMPDQENVTDEETDQSEDMNA